MTMSYEEFEDCYDEAIREVDGELESLKERFTQMEVHRRVLDAARDAYSKMNKLAEELERRQSEIDDLTEQLEQKQQETDDLHRQLLESQNERLEAEKQHLEVEVHARPMEIHNHFGAGSTSQVFNEKVNGRFEKARKFDKLCRKERKEKKRWKKIVRKML